MRYRQLGSSGLRVSASPRFRPDDGDDDLRRRGEVLLRRRHRSRWRPPPARPLPRGGGEPRRHRRRLLVDVLVEVAEKRGTSPAQVALAWLIQRPAVASVIVGARTEHQLAADLGAADLATADLELTDDEMTRLSEVSARPLTYPYWHQAKTASDRLSAADPSLLKRHLRG